MASTAQHFGFLVTAANNRAKWGGGWGGGGRIRRVTIPKVENFSRSFDNVFVG
jgi:hypothetical protein